MWTIDELVEQWSLDPSDRDLLMRRETTGRLGLIAQLSFYRRYRRFPGHQNEFARVVLDHLAEQIELPLTTLEHYAWDGRTGRRHREEMLGHLGVRRFDAAAEVALQAWLIHDALPMAPKPEALAERITEWLAREKIARPGDYRFDRLVRRSEREYEIKKAS